MIAKLCNRCGRKAEPGKKRCERCEPERRKRDGARNGSTTAWRKLRRRILLRDKHRCRACRSAAFLEVHHYDGDYTNNAYSNLVTLCEACHQEVTAGRMDSPEPPKAAAVWPGGEAPPTPERKNMGRGQARVSAARPRGGSSPRGAGVHRENRD